VSPNGKEHLFIVDRIKELIKVKGNQVVSKADWHAFLCTKSYRRRQLNWRHLLQHPLVADAAVIPVYDAAAEEVPKAIIVKDPSFDVAGKSNAELAAALAKHVIDHKSRHKWLKGGVEFVTELPKSTSGKILRRLLRDKEREKSSNARPKL
jgi:acyl-CoA synthetase (AMP-forming)/AMP-acid ligase II